MAKDYYYLVGFSTHEGSDFVWLSSKKKYTEKQFKKMCISVAPEATRRFLLSVDRHDDKEWLVLCDIRFEILYDYIADQLAEQYGFKIMVPQTDVTLFGWANMLDTEDWKMQRCEIMEAMREKMAEAGFERGFRYKKTDLLEKPLLKKPRSKK